jgi:hypothetical protein
LILKYAILKKINLIIGEKMKRKLLIISFVMIAIMLALAISVSAKTIYKDENGTELFECEIADSYHIASYQIKNGGFAVPGQGPVGKPANGGFAVPGQVPAGKPANGFAVPGQGPVVPPKSGGFVPTPPPKPAANVDPRLAEAMAKLISLDPTSKEIVLQLIDKLSQS